MANATIKAKTLKMGGKPKGVRTSNKFAWSTGAILGGLLIGWMVLLFTGNSPVDYFTGIWQGNFGSGAAIGNLIGTLSWMLPIGLAMVVSFRAGIFNIGATGQMIGGALAGYFFVQFVDLGGASVIFSIFLPVIVGASIAWLIAKLKVKYGINEVISSIMLNWIIFWLMSLLTNPDIVPSVFNANGTELLQISEQASLGMKYLGGEFFGNSSMNIGIFIAVPLVIIFTLLFKKTTWGVKQDVIGSNPTAADYIGMKANKTITQSMMISGALAGLAGAIFYLGVQGNIPIPGNDLPVQGFQGITLSLIAFNSPLGLIGSSAFVGVLTNAGTTIESMGVNPYVTDAVLALSIYGSGIVNFFIIYRPHDKFLNWLAEGSLDNAVKSTSNKVAVEKVVAKMSKTKLTKAELNKKTLSQLKELAKKNKITGYSKLTKKELVELISQGGDK